MRVLVTGASGLLGAKVVDTLRASGHQVVGARFRNARDGCVTLDLMSTESVGAVVGQSTPDAIVHAAAWTDVDACEADPDRAHEVNARGSERLARAADERGARYVYVSSDYVFDGDSGPYSEDSAPRPLSVYGASKLAGELPALASGRGAVVRVGILYGYNGPRDKPTVVRSVVNGLRAGRRIGMDDRRTKYPTLIDDVARGIERILLNDGRGIFHFCGAEGMTRLAWARNTARAFDLDASLLHAEPETARTARRPRDVQLLDRRRAFEHTPSMEALSDIRRAMEGS